MIKNNSINNLLKKFVTLISATIAALFLIFTSNHAASAGLWNKLEELRPTKSTSNVITQPQDASPSPPSAITTTANSITPYTEFISLKSNNTNLRSGPSRHHAVVINICCAHYPLAVLDRFEQWIKVIDHRGNKGWIHEKLARPSQSAIFIGQEQKSNLISSRWRPKSAAASASATQPPASYILRLPEDGARPTAWIEQGAILKIGKCLQHGWCKVQDRGGKVAGWVQRSALWGYIPKQDTLPTTAAATTTNQ